MSTDGGHTETIIWSITMSLPDLINGALEASGGLFIALSVVKLHRAKVVSGVSAVHVGFFSTWGFWNLFYYPHLDQWLSFWGGFFLVAVNCVWLGQIFYYNRRNRLSLYERGERTPQAIGQHNARDIETEHFRYDAATRTLTEKTPMEADQYGGFDRLRPTPRFRHADK